MASLISEKSLKELEGAVEAILFASGEAVSVDLIARALGVDLGTARAVTLRLGDEWARAKRGIALTEADGAFRLCTNPLFYSYAAALKEPARKKLTQAAIETLAIIAYRQPVTKARIEEIRGVDASHAVNRLVEAGLVREVGRAEAAGRPILFGTTDIFMRYYNLTSLSELPIMEAEIATGIEAGFETGGAE